MNEKADEIRVTFSLLIRFFAHLDRYNKLFVSLEIEDFLDDSGEKKLKDMRQSAVKINQMAELLSTATAEIPFEDLFLRDIDGNYVEGDAMFKYLGDSLPEHRDLDNDQADKDYCPDYDEALEDTLTEKMWALAEQSSELEEAVQFVYGDTSIVSDFPIKAMAKVVKETPFLEPEIRKALFKIGFIDDSFDVDKVQDMHHRILQYYRLLEREVTPYTKLFLAFLNSLQMHRAEMEAVNEKSARTVSIALGYLEKKLKELQHN